MLQKNALKIICDLANNISMLCYLACIYTLVVNQNVVVRLGKYVDITDAISDHLDVTILVYSDRRQFANKNTLLVLAILEIYKVQKECF